jgi:hypothetical protein
LVSFSNPRGRITNSDLELAGSIAHNDVLAQLVDVTEATTQQVVLTTHQPWHGAIKVPPPPPKRRLTCFVASPFISVTTAISIEISSFLAPVIAWRTIALVCSTFLTPPFLLILLLNTHSCGRGSCASTG